MEETREAGRRWGERLRIREERGGGRIARETEGGKVEDSCEKEVEMGGGKE